MTSENYLKISRERWVFFASKPPSVYSRVSKFNQLSRLTGPGMTSSEMCLDLLKMCAELQVSLRSL